MRIAYIGIDLLISAFNALLNEDCEIVEIFTCKTDNKTEFNTKIIESAKKLGVPYTTDRITSEDFLRLESKQVDAVICAGYYHKIPTATTIPIVNIHPSLLPVGRGAWPMPIAILKGMSHSGVTFHKITDGFDEGDIIAQKSFKISKKENLKSFMKKVDAAIEQIVPAFVRDFSSIYNNAVPQGKGEYWAAPEQEDWTVTEQMDFAEIDRILRAFYGYECILKSNGSAFELIGGQIKRRRPLVNDYIELSGKGFITADSIVQIQL